MKKINHRNYREQRSNMEGINEKTSYSTSTINKYLNNLQNKGIVTYKDKLYILEDQMIKAWLEHEKETRGFYPQ